ncbi:NUDIX hydrolase [soil metagenome]
MTAKPWTVTASSTLFHDRWLKVRADTCLTAEGVEISPYYILDYPDWIQIVAIDADDHILLVEQYRHGAGVMSLELPTGGMEPADANPLAAGARDLAEENGYTARTWRLVSSLSPNPANHSNRCHILLATDLAQTTEPADDPTERLRLVRLPLAEAVGLALSGGMIQQLHVAALLLGLTADGRWPYGPVA